MEELAYYNASALQGLSELDKFQQLLNKVPDAGAIKVNTLANNSQYIPIGVIENQLDETYNGLWQTKNFTFQVIANEIVGSIELHVFHPVAREWVVRIGSGAAMIQTAKDKPATVDNKIKNTLVKDFPHLKSECIKNAARSLGVVFGRNLNRNLENYEFVPIQDQAAEIGDAVLRALELLDKAPFKEDEKTRMRAKIQNANLKSLLQYIKTLEKWEQ